MNLITLTGRLTRDAKVEDKVAYATVAVGRNYKGKDGEYGSDFVDVRLFPRTKEQKAFWEKHLTKGRLVTLRGHIQSSQYEKDGETVYNTAIIVDQINPFLEAAKREDEPELPELEELDLP